jgi:hypothetical protein
MNEEGLCDGEENDIAKGYKLEEGSCKCFLALRLATVAQRFLLG